MKNAVSRKFQPSLCFYASVSKPVGPVSWQHARILNEESDLLVRGPRYDLVLQRTVEVVEVVTVARDANDQVSVFTRRFLSTSERLRVDDVKLDVVSIHAKVRTDQVSELLQGGLVAQHVGEEALI